MNQPVAQSPIKAMAPEDLGLPGSRNPRYRGQSILGVVYATGWNMHPWCAPGGCLQRTLLPHSARQATRDVAVSHSGCRSTGSSAADTWRQASARSLSPGEAEGCADRYHAQ